MPLYEYACEHCSATFEELVPSAESTHAIVCPQCGNTNVRKRLSTFASRVGQSPRTAASTCATGGCCMNGQCNF